MFRRTITVMFLILAAGTCAVQAKREGPAKNCHPVSIYSQHRNNSPRSAGFDNTTTQQM